MLRGFVFAYGEPPVMIEMDEINIIGDMYRYPNDDKLFKLKEIDDSLNYRFECGHWCSDSVFLDLINCRMGIQNYKINEGKQLRLEI